jgi:pimeloyl-ACP methyl ester carboxylesterase
VRDLGGPHAPAEGPVVLLVHANGFHGAVWGPLAAVLPAVRAVAPDLRAHGASTRPADGDLGWEQFADDVLAVVDDLVSGDRTGPPIVGVGHSLGGAALLLAEQRRPGTFAALHLYEPVVFPPSLDGSALAEPLAERALRRRDRFASRHEAYDGYAAKPPLAAFHPDVLRAYVDHGLGPDPDHPGELRLRCRPADEAEVFRRGADSRAFDHLGQVTCPVVVARGALAGPGPAHLAAFVAEALPHGRVEVHDDLGHFGPLERPAQLAAAVAEVVTPLA